MSTKPLLILLGFCILFAAEFFFFKTYVSREITGNYPPYHDQTGYLLESYRLYEKSLSSGLATSVSQHLTYGHPNGVMLPLQTLLPFFLAGPSRLSALSLGLFYFFLLQGMVFAAIYRQKESLARALCGVGALLALGSPFFFAGGLFDYRIDFIALCLYGSWCASILLSRMFQSLRWTLVSFVLVFDLIFFRFITIAYVLPVMVALWSFAALRHYRSKPTERTGFRRQFLHLSFSLFGIVLCILLILAVEWRELYAYYGVGHVFGPEKEIRALEQGVDTWKRFLRFYPRSLFYDHLTWHVWVPLGLAFLIWIFSLKGHAAQLKNSLSKTFPIFPVFFLTLCVLVPMGILTLDVSKSPLVIGIAGVPVILLFFTLLPALPKPALFSRRFAIVSLGAIAFFYGGFCFAQNTILQSDPLRRGKNAAVNQLYEKFWSSFPGPESGNARIAFFSLNDAASPDAYYVWAYEHHGKLPRLEPVLQQGIFAVDHDHSLEALKKADFILLNSPPYPPSYPFFKSMESSYPELMQWCRQNAVLLGSYQIEGQTWSFYGKSPSR